MTTRVPDRLLLLLGALTLCVGTLWFPGAKVFQHAITPKTIAITVLVIFMGLSLASRPLRGFRIELKPAIMDLGLILFLVAAAVSMFGVLNPWRAVAGMGFLLVFPAWYFAVSHSGDIRAAEAWLLPAITAAGTLAAVHALFQLLGFDPLSRWIVKPFMVCSVFGNPNYLGGFLALSLPAALACLHLSPRLWKKLLFGLCCGLEFIAVLATRSRAGLLAAVIVVLFFAALRMMAKSKKFKADAIISWSAIILCLIIWFFVLNPGRSSGASSPTEIQTKDKMIRTLKTDSDYQRSLIWRSALKMGADNPLRGVGINNFGSHYAVTVTRIARNMNGFDKPELLLGIADSAHNEHLQVWAELGIIGVVAWFILLGAVALASIGALKRNIGAGEKTLIAGAPVAGLGALMVLITADFPLHIAPSALLGWTYLALLKISLPRSNSAAKPAIKPGALAGYLCLIIAAGLSFFCIGSLIRHAESDLRYNQGFRAFSAGDFEEAIQKISSAIDINPGKPEYYYWRGRAYEGNKNPGLAAWDLEQAKRLGMDSPAIDNELGLLWDQAHIWHKAEQAFNAGLSMLTLPGQSGHVDILVNMGNMIKSRDNDWTNAIPWYQLAARTDPRDARAWKLLGTALMQSRDFKGGLDALNRAYSLESENPDIMERIGEAYHHLGDFGSAADWYHRAIEKDPGFPRAYLNLGILEETMNRIEEAKQFYKKAVYSAPASEEAMEARRRLAPLLEQTSQP